MQCFPCGDLDVSFQISAKSVVANRVPCSLDTNLSAWDKIKPCSQTGETLPKQLTACSCELNWPRI